MAVNFGKKKPPVQTQDNPPFEPGNTTKAATQSGGFGSKPGTGKVSFLKRGDAVKKAEAKEEALAAERKAMVGRMWRFFLNEGETRQITFLDGALDDDGMIEAVAFYQHTIAVNGRFENFICTADQDQTQPCPICASGKEGSHNSLVYALTILDHTPHTIQKGQNAGKVLKDERKLFVCTRKSMQVLTALGTKRGGLQGCTFDVSRTGDKDPRVGNMFDFVHKYGSYEEIAAKYGLKEEEVQPANYDEELVYRTPEELIELGVGKAHGGSFSNKNSFNQKSLADQL